MKKFFWTLVFGTIVVAILATVVALAACFAWFLEFLFGFTASKIIGFSIIGIISLSLGHAMACDFLGDNLKEEQADETL